MRSDTYDGFRPFDTLDNPNQFSTRPRFHSPHSQTRSSRQIRSQPVHPGNTVARQNAQYPNDRRTRVMETEFCNTRVRTSRSADPATDKREVIVDLVNDVRSTESPMIRAPDAFEQAHVTEHARSARDVFGGKTSLQTLEDLVRPNRIYSQGSSSKEGSSRNLALPNIPNTTPRDMSNLNRIARESKKHNSNTRNASQNKLTGLGKTSCCGPQNDQIDLKSTNTSQAEPKSALRCSAKETLLCQVTSTSATQHQAMELAKCSQSPVLRAGLLTPDVDTTDELQRDDTGYESHSISAQLNIFKKRAGSDMAEPEMKRSRLADGGSPSSSDITPSTFISKPRNGAATIPQKPAAATTEKAQFLEELHYHPNFLLQRLCISGEDRLGDFHIQTLKHRPAFAVLDSENALIYTIETSRTTKASYNPDNGQIVRLEGPTDSECGPMNVFLVFSTYDLKKQFIGTLCRLSLSINTTTRSESVLQTTLRRSAAGQLPPTKGLNKPCMREDELRLLQANVNRRHQIPTPIESPREVKLKDKMKAIGLSGTQERVGKRPASSHLDLSELSARDHMKITPAINRSLQDGKVVKSEEDIRPDSMRSLLTELGPTSSRPMKPTPKWEKDLIFPLDGPRAGKVTLGWKDLSRLEQHEWLNDTLIDFGLRYAQWKQKEKAEKIYFFNTYFYATITAGAKGKSSIDYDAVKRWTSKVELFTYDQVVVPINENSHWYLAIICNLPKLLQTAQKYDDAITDTPPAGSAPENIAREDRPMTEPIEEGTESADKMEAKHPDLVMAENASGTKYSNSTDSQAQLHQDGNQHSMSTAPLDGEDIKGMPKSMTQNPPPEMNQESKKMKKKNRGATYDPTTPAIIVMDSFGEAHPQVIRNLKDYLCQEAKSKLDAEIDKLSLQGVNAKGMPTQSNFSDCGLYCIKYVQRFLQDPHKFVSRILRREMRLDTDWPNFKPATLRLTYRDAINDQYYKQNPQEKDKPLNALEGPRTSMVPMMGSAAARESMLMSEDEPSLIEVQSSREKTVSRSEKFPNCSEPKEKPVVLLIDESSDRRPTLGDANSDRNISDVNHVEISPNYDRSIALAENTTMMHLTTCAERQSSIQNSTVTPGGNDEDEDMLDRPELTISEYKHKTVENNGASWLDELQAASSVPTDSVTNRANPSQSSSGEPSAYFSPVL